MQREYSESDALPVTSGGFGTLRCLSNQLSLSLYVVTVTRDYAATITAVTLTQRRVTRTHVAVTFWGEYMEQHASFLPSLPFPWLGSEKSCTVPIATPILTVVVDQQLRRQNFYR